MRSPSLSVAALVCVLLLVCCCGGSRSGVFASCPGKCQNTALPCAGTYQSGMCPGPNNIKCCVSGGGATTAAPRTSAPAAPSSPTSTTSPAAPGGLSPAPAGGDLSSKIYQAALAYKGTSTASAPGTQGGVLACAYAVNQVLVKAGIKPIGSNTNLVSSVVQALAGGRGTKISAAQCKPGDIVVAVGQHHIGISIANGCSRVLSNSSSKKAFVWESGVDFAPSYHGTDSIWSVKN